MNETIKTPMSGADAEILDLLKKTSEQYRVYKELNDVANIGRKSAFPPGPDPTPEKPLTSGTFSIEAK